MTRPLVKNVADEGQVKEASNRAKIGRDMELDDLRVVLSTDNGRRFIWRLINEVCHYDTLSAEHSGSMTYMREGERNVGRIVKADCYDAAFETYQLMEKEYMKRQMEKE